VGHALVSRAGDRDYSLSSFKVPKYLLNEIKGLCADIDSRTVVMEVDIR